MKNNKLIFMFCTLFAFLTTSCIFNTNMTIPNSFSTSGKYKGNAEEEMAKIYRNIIQTIKAKKNYEGDINININTGMLIPKNDKTKVFSVQSSKEKTETQDNVSMVRKKQLIGNTITNQSHIKNNDINIFDPSKPESLGQLQPYDGDISFGTPNTTNFDRVSSMKINDNPEFKFAPGRLLVKFNDLNGLNIFKNLYNAKVLDEINGYYMLELDLTTAPIQNLDTIIREYNKSIAGDIKRLEFSSLASLKTLTILFDFASKYKNTLGGILVDRFFDDLPMDPVNTVPHKSVVFSDSNILSVAAGLTGWYQTATHITDAWQYTIGSNSKLTWIEAGQGYKIDHPEIKRRLKTYGDNHQNVFGSDNILDGDDPTHLCNNKYISGMANLLLAGICNSEGQRYHAHYALMTCCAEKENLDPTTSTQTYLPTVGSAPNVETMPYSAQYLGSITKVLKKASTRNPSVIGINMAFGSDLTTTGLMLSDLIIIDSIQGKGPMESEIDDIVNNKKIPIVVAAHNYARNIFTDNWYPANDKNVITIGNISIFRKNESQAYNSPNNIEYRAFFDTSVNRYGGYTVYFPTPNFIPCLSVKDGLDKNHTCNYYNGKGSNYGKTDMVWGPGNSIDVARYELESNKIKEVNKSKNLPGGFSGTSAATPYITGIISLLKSVNPDLTPQRIKDILLDTAKTSGVVAKPHTWMQNDNFKDDIHLVNAEEAVIQAIREKIKGSNVPNDFVARDFVGFFDNYFNNTDNSRQVYLLNQKTPMTLKYTTSNTTPEFTGKVVKFRGWNTGLISDSKISNNILELLNFDGVKELKPSIIRVSCASCDQSDKSQLGDGRELIIEGVDLYAPQGSYGKINFEKVSSSEVIPPKVFTLDLNEDVGVHLDPEGRIISCMLDTNKAKDSTGKTLKSDLWDKGFSNYKISFTTIVGETNKYILPSTIGFKIQNQLSTITIPTSNGGTEIVPVVTSGSKTIVTGGQKIAIPINESIASRLGNITMGSLNLSLLEIVKNYAIYGIPDYNPLTMSTIRNQILSLLVKDTSGNTIYTINDALKFAALAINLNPKYPDGGSVLSNAPFIMNNTNNDANKIIKVKQGDVVALSVLGVDTNSPKSITVYEANYGNQFDIYKRDGNVVYFTVSLNAPLGLNSIVFYDNDSTSSDGLIFHNAIEVIKGDSVTSGGGITEKILFTKVTELVGIHGNSVYTINSDGTGLNKIGGTYAGSNPIWNNDKTQIAYTYEAGMSHVKGLILASPDRAYDMYIQCPDALFFTKFSPDGKKVGFITYGNGRYKLFTINSDGSGLPFEPRYPNGEIRDYGIFYWKLFNPNSSIGSIKISDRNIYNSPYFDWSPDASKIVFKGADDNGIQRIYISDSDGTNESLLSSEDGLSMPTFTKDNRIVYIRNANEVAIMDIDGSNKKTLRSNITFGISDNDADLKTSQDGKYISFIDAFADGYVMNKDGSNLVKINDTHKISRGNANGDHRLSISPVSWSQDSTRLTFISNNVLYLVNKDGTNLKAIFSQDKLFDASFSIKNTLTKRKK